MNLQWLYYFNTIAELEHYTRAAEKLHVSQSNLSHAIKELENELGVQLFERQGRNIKLTKYGEIFQPYVIRTINSLEDGITTLKGISTRTRESFPWQGFRQWHNLHRISWCAINLRPTVWVYSFSTARKDGKQFTTCCLTVRLI